MEYFGTDLTNHGHYRWSLNGQSFGYERSLQLSDLPFNPEELTKDLPKGETVFYQTGRFTVLAISGSPVDKRGGTKSVFWVNGCISKSMMYSEIMRNTLGRKIVEQMPFEINWRLEY